MTNRRTRVDVQTSEAGNNAVRSPIFAHKHFERLEAEGAARIVPMLKKLRAVVGAS